MSKRLIVLWLCLSCMLLTACVTAMDEALPYGELPELTMATPVRLVASPNHATAYLSQTPIPAGTAVELLGSDENAAWLLVRHEGMLGWMPTIFSRTNVANLPAAFTLDPVPSECIYLETLFDLEDTWTSPFVGGALVVGSLYRYDISEEFEDATLHLTIEGSGHVAEGDYVHTALADGHALILFGFSVAKLAKGGELAFALVDAGEEPVDFAASIFSSDCQEEELTDVLPVGQERRFVVSKDPDDKKPSDELANDTIEFVYGKPITITKGLLPFEGSIQQEVVVLSEQEDNQFAWREGSPYVTTRIVYDGTSAFIPTRNNHFYSNLGLIGYEVGEIRYVSLKVYLLKEDAALLIQANISGSWEHRWGIDGRSSFQGYPWRRLGEYVDVPIGQWVEITVDLIEQLGAKPGQELNGLAFGGSDGNLVYDRVVLINSE
jgi:hypothetical protein